MSEHFRCGDNAALVGYLYDDCGPEEQRAIAAHVLLCATCAEELEALSATRAQLLSWTPPHAELDFRIVSDAPRAKVVRPARWWQQPMPAWGQAVAAVLIFGVGLSIGAIRGSLLRTATSPQPGSSRASAPAATVSANDLAVLEERLRAEMRQLQTASTSTAPASPAAGDTQMLARVRALIQESEERQQRELALRTTEIVRDFDAQRRGDLVKIERTFGQMEGTTGVQVEQQRQMLNYLMRVSQGGR